jgi:fumarylacetoacetate (FAA) hydrolase family protein
MIDVESRSLEQARDCTTPGGFGPCLSSFDRSAAHKGVPDSELSFQITTDDRKGLEIAGET